VGDPGTGKSRVIGWLIRMFEEAMEWTHGQEFICVAFQNKVAHAMKGSTLHSDADLQIGNQNYAALLEYTDVDNLFTRNEHRRVILMDEVFMIPDRLLESFCYKYEQAAPRSSGNPYTEREDGTQRILGGMNFLMFGDMNQLPPIPASAALFIPPAAKSRTDTKSVLDIFWNKGPDSLNFFKELTTQKRTTDAWYRHFLQQCRIGQLEDEEYNFIMGLPTRHKGAFHQPPHEQSINDDPFLLECYTKTCDQLEAKWKELIKIIWTFNIFLIYFDHPSIHWTIQRINIFPRDLSI
jgi:hypothetical protein